MLSPFICGRHNVTTVCCFGNTTISGSLTVTGTMSAGTQTTGLTYPMTSYGSLFFNNQLNAAPANAGDFSWDYNSGGSADSAGVPASATCGLLNIGGTVYVVK